ncbi:MAG: DUF2905 domain-containing protein [Weeksellaceae bacterium]|jgi:membrane protein implicated in regulation of membrane protease activity|nr:DUF2905 domain-containing protein [Weeksellaceae bacterium]
MGKILIIIGALLLVVGLIVQFTHFDFSWFGRLPGDIRIEKPGFSLYVPLVSMLIVSVVLSLLFWIVRKINF